jgi:methyl-accepting chemotaxis protein
LARARKHAHLEGDAPLLDAIAIAALAAPSEAAVSEMVRNVRQLNALNRRAMVEVGDRAKRLATAGAWASVLIAIASFVLTIVVVGRLHSRVLSPIGELYSVAKAVRAGDLLRRARAISAPAELREILTAINTLLDGSHAQIKAVDGVAPGIASIERLALLHFLEHDGEPCFVADNSGAVLATNGAGLELLSKAEGDAFRARLAAIATSGVADRDATRLGTCGWLYRPSSEP